MPSYLCWKRRRASSGANSCSFELPLLPKHNKEPPIVNQALAILLNKHYHSADGTLRTHCYPKKQSHHRGLIVNLETRASDPGQANLIQDAILEGEAYGSQVARGGQGGCVLALLRYHPHELTTIPEVQNETNKDGSGKGQWSAWKVFHTGHAH